MYKFSCKMVKHDCGYEVEGETMDEVRSLMLDHAIEHHPEMMDVLSVEEKHEVLEKLDDAIEAA